MLRIVIMASLLGLTACVETTTPMAQTTAAPQQSALLGNWRTTQSCAGEDDQTNILKITTASASQVLGTTNVGNASGSIVGGTVNGSDFTFTNIFIATWDQGQQYTEVWIGHLAADGSSVSGTYTSDFPGRQTVCTFAGPKA